MTAFEYWQEQRDVLSASLHKDSSMADVVYSIRHALLQTEQNLLAAQSDEVLRQQLGVLFSLAKSSAAYLQAPMTTSTWVAQSRKHKVSGGKKLIFRLLPVGLILLCGLFCYFEKLTLGWILSLLALVAYGLSFLPGSKKAGKASPHEDALRVTIQPDIDRLLEVIDGQMRTIDRCINDFTYLNDSMRGQDQAGSAAMAGKMATLMEAVYDVESEERQPLEDAVQGLLSDMGLSAIPYSAQNAQLFTALPSKNETRTLCPAIVTADDFKLLRRGTAAVNMNKE
ncbi:MAG: hypothetical protein E7331_08430 [Clostridiales bacterium]|nr:hypothetical protein [Clostridiales bacterium]